MAITAIRRNCDQVEKAPQEGDVTPSHGQSRTLIFTNRH